MRLRMPAMFSAIAMTAAFFAFQAVPAQSSVILDDCPTLMQGNTGGCVNELQTELNEDLNLSPPMAVDGTFGPGTRQAVITFQQDNGIAPADGIVGPQTKTVLDNANSVSTPVPAPTPAAGGSYVALGDSYSAGEGLAPFLPGSDTSTDTCHRSSQAYSQYVTPGPGVFVACSGQTTQAFTTPATTGREAPQDSWLDQNTGLITLTFGGNDVDWTSALLDCTKLQAEVLHTTVYGNPGACSQQLDDLPRRIAVMQQNLVALYTNLLELAPNARIRVLDYPPLFPDRGGATSGCRIGRLLVDVGSPTGWQFVIAHDVEQQFVQLEQQANAAIADAVVQVHNSVVNSDRLQLVDVDAEFGGYTGHTISCGDTGRPTPWINALRLSSSQAAELVLDIDAGNWDQFHTDLFDVYSASFHPTHDGQYAMYLALSPQLPPGWS